MTKAASATNDHFDFNGFQGFPGFSYPNTTQVPDILFDHIMQNLDEKELKVLLYIVRRTFGFKKQSDNISLSQLVNGIVTKDKRVLDRGTGLSKASVARALQSLKQKNLIIARKNSDAKHGNLPTTYALRMHSDPCLSSETRGVSPQRQALVSPLRHTTSSESTSSLATAKRGKNTTSSDERELAAALMKRGLDKKTAQSFIQRYSLNRVRNNLDWFDYKCKSSPQSTIGNPAGLLYRAIENNFAAEHNLNGFQTREQKAAARAAHKQRLAVQERLEEERKRQQAVTQQQEQLARAKKLKMLRKHYHSATEERKLWHQVLEMLKTDMSALKFKTYLAQSELLSLQKDRAVVAVSSRFVKTWLMDNMALAIQQMLAKVAKIQPVRIEYRTLDQVETE